MFVPTRALDIKIISFIFSPSCISLIEMVDVSLFSKLISIKVFIYMIVTSVAPCFFLYSFFSIHNMSQRGSKGFSNCVALTFKLDLSHFIHSLV